MAKPHSTPSDSTGLDNRNVTGPESIDKPEKDKAIPPGQDKPGLENRNLTAPEPAKPPQT